MPFIDQPPGSPSGHQAARSTRAAQSQCTGRTCWGPPWSVTSWSRAPGSRARTTRPTGCRHRGQEPIQSFLSPTGTIASNGWLPSSSFRPYDHSRAWDQGWIGTVVCREPRQATVREFLETLTFLAQSSKTRIRRLPPRASRPGFPRSCKWQAISS